MKKLLGFLTFFALTSPIVRADIAESLKKSPPKVVYEKRTNIDLSKKNVDGQFLKPNGHSIRGDQNLSFDSLMKPRKDFSKELQRSSGAL